MMNSACVKLALKFDYSVVVGAHGRLGDVSSSARAAFMCASEAPTESVQRQCIETTSKTFYYKPKNTAKST